jgi:predicted amidohydrolase
MSKLNALLVQAQIQWKDPAENRHHLQSLVERNLSDDTNLIVFPETFTTGFLGDSDLPNEDMTGPTVEWMKSLAASSDSAIAGSAVIVEGEKRFNRMLLVEPGGSISTYDKRHLFAFGGEHKRYTAGETRQVISYRGWRICLQICYDLRFPVWCRNRSDYDLMLLVANWPSRRVHHWVSLLEARAIENQAWVIGLNRVGKDGNGLEYPGRSVVFDPQGATIADLGGSECAQPVTLDLDLVSQTRTDFPFQNDADSFELN